MIHVIIGYFQFPKYICHISENDKDKNTCIHSQHTFSTYFIYRQCITISLQKNHAIEMNKFEEQNKACSWPNVYPVYFETWDH